MPKVKSSDLSSRTIKRIEQLERGEEVPAKDIKAVLTPEQQQEIEAAWAEQQALRLSKSRATEAEKAELGWKTKREIRLETLRKALAQASDRILADLEKEMETKELRAARIYFDTLKVAEARGMTKEQSANLANNALTRAGLRRFDRRGVNRVECYRNENDRLEQQLKDQLGIGLTTEDEEILREMEQERKRKEKAKR
jgi:hypothetical protein